jgi:hypothetical protein
MQGVVREWGDAEALERTASPPRTACNAPSLPGDDDEYTVWQSLLAGVREPSTSDLLEARSKPMTSPREAGIAPRVGQLLSRSAGGQRAA